MIFIYFIRAFRYFSFFSPTISTRTQILFNVEYFRYSNFENLSIFERFSILKYRPKPRYYDILAASLLRCFDIRNTKLTAIGYAVDFVAAMLIYRSNGRTNPYSKPEPNR